MDKFKNHFDMWNTKYGASLMYGSLRERCPRPFTYAETHLAAAATVVTKLHRPVNAT
jgi:hypothetical protein